MSSTRPKTLALLEKYKLMPNTDTSIRNKLETLIAIGMPFYDFPIEDRFLFQMDGWQTSHGPSFRKAFFAGMDRGLIWIDQFLETNPDIKATDLVNLHQHAYPKPEDGKEFKRIPGFRENLLVTFPLSFARREKISPEDGISEDGLSEFYQAWLNAQLGYLDEKQSCWELLRESKNSQETLKFTSEGNFKSKFLQDSTRLHDGIFYIIQTNKASAATIEEYVQAALEDFYSQARLLNLENKEDSDKFDLMLEKIIRDFHQHHFFADGNGRTFVFYLKNILLFQFKKIWARTETPFHQAGFSAKELVAESRVGRVNFENCKITKAKNFIIEAKEIPSVDSVDFENFKNSLKENLSTDSVTLLAQLNELFYQIENGLLPIKETLANSAKKLLTAMYTDEIENVLTFESNYCNQYKEHILKNHLIIKSIPHEIRDKLAERFLFKEAEQFLENKEPNHIEAIKISIDLLKVAEDKNAFSRYQNLLFDALRTIKNSNDIQQIALLNTEIIQVLKNIPEEMKTEDTKLFLTSRFDFFKTNGDTYLKQTNNTAAFVNLRMALQCLDDSKEADTTHLEKRESLLNTLREIKSKETKKCIEKCIKSPDEMINFNNEPISFEPRVLSTDTTIRLEQLKDLFYSIQNDSIKIKDKLKTIILKDMIALFKSELTSMTQQANNDIFNEKDNLLLCLGRMESFQDEIEKKAAEDAQKQLKLLAEKEEKELDDAIKKLQTLAESAQKEVESKNYSSASEQYCDILILLKQNNKIGSQENFFKYQDLLLVSLTNMLSQASHDLNASNKAIRQFKNTIRFLDSLPIEKYSENTKHFLQEGLQSLLNATLSSLFYKFGLIKILKDTPERFSDLWKVVISDEKVRKDFANALGETDKNVVETNQPQDEDDFVDLYSPPPMFSTDQDKFDIGLSHWLAQPLLYPELSKLIVFAKKDSIIRNAIFSIIRKDESIRSKFHSIMSGELYDLIDDFASEYRMTSDSRDKVSHQAAQHSGLWASPSSESKLSASNEQQHSQTDSNAANKDKPKNTG